MFAKTLKSILLIGLFTIPFSQTPPVLAQTCAPAPVGLISAWSGDGNALDARSRSNGTFQNGATLAAGQVGQAFSFDGADDQITAPANDNQNLGAITVEAWINPTTIPHGATIVQKRSASNVGGFLLELTGAPSGNANGLGFYVDAFGGSFGSVFTPANAITPGVWTHVAGTFDGDFLRIYVNGVEVGSTQTNFHTITLSAEPLLIGRNAVNGTGYNGKIDELALYNRALSAAEIQAIYNAGTTGKCKPLATFAPENQLVWMAGDGDARDSAGNNNVGLLSPTGAGYTVGKVGQAFRLDGVNGFVNVGTPANSSQAFTVEGWIRRASASVVTNNPVSATPAGLIYSYGAGGYGFLIDQPTNKLAVSRIGVSQANSNSLTITDTNWHHVAVTKTGSAMTFYLDGVSDTVTYSETFQFNSPAFIGRRGDGAGGNEFFGDVDEISQYSRPLTAVEIQSIFNAGLAGKYKAQSTVPGGIAAWYPGDGNPNDFEAANNAALQGGAGFAQGKVGQAFSLNGTDAFAQAPSTAGNDPTGAVTGASMEAWVNFSQRPSDAGRQMYIISKTGAGGTEGFDIHVDPDNFFKFVWGGSYMGFANVAVQTGVWYHVVATFSQTTTGSVAGVKFYINGALRGIGNVFNPRTASNVPLEIGNSSALGAGNRLFNGLIDEPTVYNRALTPEEVRDLFYAGSGGKYKTATNPTVSNKTKTGDAEVTFGAVTTGGAAQQTPLDKNLLPPLPMGTNTGLVYDISTSAAYANPSVCFNLPSFTPAQFPNLRVYHLESGVWQNRTMSNVYPNLCASGMSSLSPFAISLIAPTAANVSIGGRVRSGKSGLSNVVVTLSGGNLQLPVSVKTNSFGYYKFTGLPVGETYILTVSSKRYVFSPSTLMLNLYDEVPDADFVADEL
ncbi:MAG TPA: LamG-like jellyroll fold domain-containing protein [Pyrinomonadaceae bacterium]|jgi:hypothetical protein